MDSSEVLQSLRSRLEELNRYGVERIGVFGSYATGTMREDSDLDVLVRFRESARTFDNYMDLKELLEKLLGCPVDLVIADTVKPRLRAAIEREMVHAPGL